MCFLWFCDSSFVRFFLLLVEDSSNLSFSVLSISESSISKFKEMLERFAVHAVRKSYSGIDTLGVDMRQKLVENFLEKDFSYTPFEIKVRIRRTISRTVVFAYQISV